MSVQQSKVRQRPEFNLTTASTLFHLISAVAISTFLWIVIATMISS